MIGLVADGHLAIIWIQVTEAHLLSARVTLMQLPCPYLPCLPICLPMAEMYWNPWDLLPKVMLDTYIEGMKINHPSSL